MAGLLRKQSLVIVAVACMLFVRAAFAQTPPITDAAGSIQGPLTAFGLPAIPKQDPGGDETSANLPTNIGGVRSANQCEGDNCAAFNESFGETGNEASVAIISPSRAFNDAMNSKTLQDRISANTSLGGQALSPLALTFQSWQNASPQSAAAMIEAFKYVQGENAGRDQAAQTIKDTLKSSGNGGDRLYVAYQRCVAELVKNGFTQAAAQEGCLKQQGKGSNLAVLTGETKEEKDLGGPDTLSFIYHPSHPAYQGKRSVYNALSQSWTERDFNNRNLLTNVFDPADNDPKQIKLRHLLFVPTLVGAATESFQNSGEVDRGVRQLAADWLNLFGDIQYVYQEGGVPNSPFMRTAVKRIKPTFTYEEAVGRQSVVQFEPAIFKNKGASNFEQYVAFKTHYVYYTLWQVMSKYCRSSQLVKAGPVNPNADTESFWTPSQTPDPAHISQAEVQTLSTSFATFDRVIGQEFYNYAQQLLMPSQQNLSLCDVMDPTKSAASSEPNLLNAGETSVKKLLSDSPDATNAAAGARYIALTFASIVAADQVNTTVQAGYTLLGNLTGGDIESEARAAGYNLLQVVAPGYGTLEFAQRNAAYYPQLFAVLKERNASAIGKPL